jgi:RND family efflux transporter MFP subunit
MTFKRAAVLVLVTYLLVACGRKEHPAAEKAPTGIKGVAVEVVKAESLPEMLDVVGSVRSRTAAMVSPRIAGVIAVMRVKEGDRVKKGDVIARLDAQENQAAALAAGNAVDEARRALDEATARKKLADTQFERYRNLFKADAVSRQEFDQKETEKELALQGVARAEARLQQSQAQAKGAGTVADYTRIVAPISGIVTSRLADLGATVFPAQPLFTIEDEGGYQLELAIPETMATRVRPGSSVQIIIDALGSSFAAKIAEVVPAADPASRTFIAKVPLAQKGVKSGMFGRGAISLGTAVNGLSVSRKSLVERGALTSVWVVDNGNVARLRLVKAGRVVGERVEILAGLSAGERVVTDGVDKVSDGAKVE